MLAGIICVGFVGGKIVDVAKFGTIGIMLEGVRSGSGGEKLYLKSTADKLPTQNITNAIIEIIIAVSVTGFSVISSAKSRIGGMTFDAIKITPAPGTKVDKVSPINSSLIVSFNIRPATSFMRLEFIVVS